MPNLVHLEQGFLVQWVNSVVGEHTTPNFAPSTGRNLALSSMATEAISTWY